MWGYSYLIGVTKEERQSKAYIDEVLLKYMENLTEKVADYVQQKSKESSEKPYEGLEVIEDKPYAGPTSIRYWM